MKPEDLEFLKGVVAGAAATFAPILKNVCFHADRAQAQDGRLIVDVPSSFAATDILAPAVKFLKALESGGNEANVQNKDGKLVITHGRFRATMAVSSFDGYPVAEPTKGKLTPCKNLLPTLRKLRPFVGEDATRPWCLNLLFDGTRAYATTGSMIAVAPVKKMKFGLPSFLVDEMLRLAEEPTAYTEDADSITFHYEGERWLKSQLVAGEWPRETLLKIVEGCSKIKLDPLPEDFAATVEALLPFVEEPKFPVINLSAEGVSTEAGVCHAVMSGKAWPDCSVDARNFLPMLAASDSMAFDLEKKRIVFGHADGFLGVLATVRSSHAP